MLPPTPFGTPLPGKEDTVWGHTFTWTDAHPSESDISHLLYSYDELATTALDRLDEIAPPASKVWRCPGAEGPGQRDLYSLLEEHADKDPVLSKLWEEITTVPEWVDWEQIARGQRLLYQYNGQILLGVSSNTISDSTSPTIPTSISIPCTLYH